MKVLITGGGPAGVSTGLYTLRAGIDTAIITNNKSALLKAEKIDNYYGFAEGISGEELYKNGLEGFKRLGGQVIEEEVTGADYDGRFRLLTDKGEYEADVLVLANGASRKTPDITGLKEFEGRGVSYCAVCDAFFYRGKKVGVIGNGEYALHEAHILEKTSSEVVLLTDGKEAPDYENCDSRKIKAIEGSEGVEKVVFGDGEGIELSGIFVAIGTAGATDIAVKLGAVTDGRYVETDENMLTSVPGLYAVGDCTGGLMQVAKAVCDGARAGVDIVRRKKG